MSQIIAKTFGGLSREYYFRQFIFGLIFPIIIFGFVHLYHQHSPSHLPSEGWVIVISVVLINTLLYPYSRFVYESITGFILGDNFFLVNAIFMLTVKFITMYLCWGFAILIAPIGLGYLYYHHSKKQKAGMV